MHSVARTYRRGTDEPPALRHNTREATAAQVERVVAKAHRVTLSELRAPGRPRASVVWARRTAMYLQRVLFELSCEDIARRFGHHRTSVLHACRKVEDRRDEPAFDRRLERLEELILRDLPGRST